MSKSGLIAFKIGVESGNSQVIKDIRKPTTLWRLLQKSSLIKKYQHIFFSANFIVGFPGETFSQMYDSFTFARKLSVIGRVFMCQPLKGTDLYSSFQHLMDPEHRMSHILKQLILDEAPHVVNLPTTKTQNPIGTRSRMAYLRS